MKNKSYIDSIFAEKSEQSEVVKAHIEIVNIQKNKTGIVKTGFKYIDDFLPDGLNNKMIFGGSRPSMGKCLEIDTPVVMFDGTIKKVQDVEVGDLLMGDDSTHREVLSLARGEEEMFKITPIKGESYTVNRSHILSLVCSTDTDKIHRKDQVYNYSIDEYLNLSQRVRDKLKTYRVAIELPEKEVPYHPYLIGAWLAEGDLRTPMINCADIELINEVKDVVDKNLFKVNNLKNIRENCYRISITTGIGEDNPFARYIKSITEKGYKRIPDVYLRNSRKNRLALLAGLLDGDGYLTYNSYEITSKYKELSEDLVYLCRSLGFAISYKEKFVQLEGWSEPRVYYRHCISGDVDEIPLRIKRKQASKRRLNKNVLRSGITVESVGNGDYYGFTITGNHLFLLGDFTVTHNTYHCAKLIDNLTNPEINKVPVKILRLNWEMNSSSLLLRELKVKLGKKMKDILASEYSDDEKIKVRETVGKLDNENVINLSKVIEGEDLIYTIDKFCQKNEKIDAEGNKIKDDLKRIILIDHLHILGDKKRIDDFLTICNDKKLEYPELSFIGYFQLNRTLETTWRGSNESKSNPKNFRPHSGHIYNTDGIQQYGDLIFSLVIPQVANLDEYASVPREYYKHLEEHFVGQNPDNTWVRLKGRNRVYIDIIKVRLVDDFEDPRLFCELLDPNKEDSDIQPFEPKDGINFNKSPDFETLEEPDTGPNDLFAEN